MIHSSAKKWLLVFVAVAGFAAGYGAVANAWPTPYHYGYFRAQYDDYGLEVWPPTGGPGPNTYNGIFGYVKNVFTGSSVGTNGCAGNGNALPTWVDTPNELTDFVLCKLWFGNQQEHIGAAFIIGTVIGTNNLSFVENDFFGGFGEFVSRVNYASSMGWITWNANPGCILPNTYYQDDRADVAAYGGCGSGGTNVVTFNFPGGSYIIKRYCSNPLGTLVALPKAPNFDMSGRSTVNDTTALPGQILTFTHYLKNNGPTDTGSSSINYVIRNTVDGSQTLSGNAGTFTNGQEIQVRVHDVTVPNNAVIGSQICRAVEWSPDNASGGSGVGTPACATVVAPPVTPTCSSLTPNPGIFDPADAYTLTGVINTTGGSAGAQAVIDAGGKFYMNVTGPGVNSSNSNVTPVTVGGNSTTGMLTATRSMPATGNVGTYTVDYGLTGSVTVSCSKVITVMYTPYFSVMGGDVGVGPGFGTGCVAELSTIKSYNLGNSAPGNYGYYGSGSQLAAFALGQNIQFATNTTLNGGTGKGTNSSGGSVLQPSGLAFSNSGTSGTVFGTSFGRSPTEDTVSHAGWCTPDYYGAAAGPAVTSTPTPLGANAIDQAWFDVHPTSGVTYSLNGDLTINGPITLGNGSSPKRITLAVTGNVTIVNNITYDNYTYTSSSVNLSDIPQFRLLVKGNIFIDKGVTQLNGFYHAQKGGANTGTIYTCAATVGGLPKYLTYTSGDTGAYSSTDSNYYASCSNPLTIYGSVAAYKLKLNRSGGNWKTAGSVTNRPAEQIIYAPELWLGGTSSAIPSRPQYDAMTSLPPIL